MRQCFFNEKLLLLAIATDHTARELRFAHLNYLGYPIYSFLFYLLVVERRSVWRGFAQHCGSQVLIK